MQRLNNLDKWKHVTPEDVMQLSGEPGRRVRIDVNAPYPVRLMHADGNGEVTFLALVEGRDVVEFFAPGDSSISVDGELWAHTFDGEKLAVVVLDAVKFTKMVTRRPRDHALELMQFHAKQNADRMYNEIYDKLRREFTGRSAAPPAPAPQPEPSGDAAGAGNEPSPDGVAGDGAGDQPADGGSGKSAANKG